MFSGCRVHLAERYKSRHGINVNVKNNMIGQFVESKSFGFGKVVNIEDNHLVVEFFISPWKRTTTKFAKRSSVTKRLPRQTRVFVEDDGKWRMGRVEMEFQRDDGGYDYEIKFPNRVKEDISGEQLFVRCLAPFDDPTAMLANGAMETQYWHDRRAAFGAQVLAQREASRGLYALLSSSIEFVPHQIEVARRVLEDPLQRYVLADEVGMGKTIEAGLVLRQFLLTNESGVVWVIVPPTLVPQWRRELERKFSIGDFPDRVDIFAFDQMHDVLTDFPQMVIVDEAHHVVSDVLPTWLVALGEHAERMLLLTATPSLANSKVLLRLLQLIDPHAYRNVTEADFEYRVEQREQLGIFLRGFRGDTAPVLLRQRLKQLAERFPNDTDAQALGIAISRSLDANDRESLQLHISSLRSHIADVYRIHQRLIRTRRGDAATWVFQPRGVQVDPLGSGDLSHILQTWTEDSAVPDLAELLEQWRIEFATLYPRGSARRVEVRQVFVSLFEAFACSTRAFGKALETVPEGLLGPHWLKSFDTALATSPPVETYSRARQVAKTVATSVRQLRVASGKSPRVVVFGSDPDDLARLADALGAEIGRNAVLLASACSSSDDDIATNFEFHHTAEVLLCGTREEEGLNLHFADLLVHLDLPFSPGRIEQRIGRLDRFGRKVDWIKQRVVLPGPLDDTNSYWDAWLDVLADGFHIFNAPLTDMQFLLAELSGYLADAMLEDGAAGLRSAIATVRERLQQERERLDNQYALDRVLQDEEGAALFCQHLEDSEADEGSLAQEAKGWFADCIKFRFQETADKAFLIGWDGDYTLLPVYPWANTFRGSMTGPKTFSRQLSNRSKKPIQLLRVGSPLYVAAERHLKWEDRGTAFATWRLEPSLGDTTWFAFKLCYQIEGKLPEGVPFEAKSALRARLDGYLPPWAETLYVGSDLQLITDSGMLDILQRPYVAGTMSSGDLNLGSRPELLQQVIDSNLFSRLCRVVRSDSEAWLLNQKAFLETIRTSVTRGTVDLERRLRRLHMRQAVLKAEHAEEFGLLREIELNQLLVASLGTPSVHLDAIGLIVVSGQFPHTGVSN